MQKSLDFLKKIKKNNNKEWFDKNKENYLAAREEFHQQLRKILPEMTAFDKTLAALDPSKLTFRIYRDVRFSKDKTPYKTNFAASINGEGKNSGKGGYYFHLEPGNSYLAGGIYMPEADKLNAIRQEIDYNFDEFKKILSQKDFKKYFGELSDEDRLVNPPKGYDKENPALEILKHKHFIVVHNVKDEQLLKNNFHKEAAKVFKAMKPLLTFLNRGIE